jgi:DNA-binding NarL/FixJ family response regulator
MSQINIILVDDHPSVRFGLEAVLNKFDDITVINVADSGQRALELCQTEQPDVAIVDLCMPGMSGLDTIRALHEQYPTIKLIVLTHADNNDMVAEALQAGAVGFLVKNAEIKDIANAIRSAVQNQRTLSPEALESIISAQTALFPHPDSTLTQRERDVLKLMAEGKKNPQIAKDLVITLSTVKFHVSSIFKKLGVETRTEAVVYAMKLGLIDDSVTS